MRGEDGLGASGIGHLLEEASATPTSPIETGKRRIRHRPPLLEPVLVVALEQLYVEQFVAELSRSLTERPRGGTVATGAVPPR